MTMVKFPTPAELRAERERKAEAEVEAAAQIINEALLKGAQGVDCPWSEPARNVIIARLRDAGWVATYTDNQRDGAWLRIEAAGPGPMDEFYAAGGRTRAP